MGALAQALYRLSTQQGVLVRVHATRGSVPRGTDAWMLVLADEQIGTIGGGHVEWQASAHAREILGTSADAAPSLVRYALGPSLGQCCGGEMTLGFQRVGAADRAALQMSLQPRHMPVAVFGGGHVGTALVKLLATLPMQVLWVDSRDSIFPTDAPSNVACEHSLPVQGAVAGLAAHTRVLIMSFSHAEDLDIVAACLRRQRERGDLPYIGLIGSKTKWASFQARLRAHGLGETELAQVHCPIGVPGIHDKRPEVIAVAVAAQLLQDM